MIIKSHNDYKVIKRLIGNFIILTLFRFCSIIAKITLAFNSKSMFENVFSLTG